MSWQNALGMTGLVTLAIMPLAIVLLYFLKLRRRPVVVPSTMLWQRTIEDMRVNSLWQRLKNNLLMWLQVLAVLLMLLAGLRPGCEGTRLPDDRYIFLVDVSASMSATDLPGGTRLEEAKRQLLGMLDRMAPHGPLDPKKEAMLIAFSDTADVLQSYTDDLSLLRRRVGMLRPTDRRSDMQEALTAASGLANPGRTSSDAGDVQVAQAQPATLVIFSDGGIRQIPDFQPGYLRPEFHAVGGKETPDNVGIAGFSLADAPGGVGRSQVFAQLFNGSSGDRTVDVSLFANDVLFDSQRGLKVPAGRTLGLSFELSTLVSNLREAVELRLVIDQADALAIDNVARLILNPPARAKVLVVSPGNGYLRLALTTDEVLRYADAEFQSPDYLQTDTWRRQAALGVWSLVIFDRVVPDVMPQASTVLLDAIPPGSEWRMGEPRFPVRVADIDYSHPVMGNVQLGNLMIVEARPLELPAGAQSLLSATFGPIMGIGPRGGFQDLVLGFSLQGRDAEGREVVNTNWPSQLSFPLFIQNVVRWLAAAGSDQSVGKLQPGDPVVLRAPPGATGGVVTTPAGDAWPLTLDGSGMAQFSQTGTAGVYQVRWSGTAAVSKFAVNLLDPQESSLRVRETLDLGFENVAAAGEPEPARREFWRWLVVLAVITLGVEWYIYNRRVWI